MAWTITTGGSLGTTGIEKTHTEGFEFAGNQETVLFSGNSTISNSLVPDLGPSPIFGLDFEVMEFTIFLFKGTANEFLRSTIVDPSLVASVKPVLSESGEFKGLGIGAGLSAGFSVTDGLASQGETEFSH